ncbi:hypothetical protein [uncultured Aliiroseovarius sp.]|uniref:hypothetical protein n=1 Tax=Aliiroseovarius sediminis TaxID=2925839 RepID=UPI00338E7C55
MRVATNSGFTCPQVSADLGVGLSTLNKWVQKHQHDDLKSGPHEDVERDNERICKEVRRLREVREVIEKRRSSMQAKAPSHRCKQRLPGNG